MPDTKAPKVISMVGTMQNLVNEVLQAAVGMARAKAYKEQVLALGQGPTALVNAVDALSRSGQTFVPNILVVGGGGRTLEGLAAQLMGVLQNRQEKEPAGFTPVQPAAPEKPKSPGAPEKGK